jgi:hypothetical protein
VPEQRSSATCTQVADFLQDVQTCRDVTAAFAARLAIRSAIDSRACGRLAAERHALRHADERFLADLAKRVDTERDADRLQLDLTLPCALHVPLLRRRLVQGNTLWVTHHDLKPDDLHVLTPLAHVLPNLAMIVVHGLTFDGQSLACVGALCVHLPHLNTLKLQDMSLADWDVKNASYFFDSISHVKDLELRHVDLGRDAEHAMIAMLSARSLSRLSLIGLDLNIDHENLLAEALSCQHDLEQVRLGCMRLCSMTDAKGVAATGILLALSQLPRLRTLDLASSDMYHLYIVVEKIAAMVWRPVSTLEVPSLASTAPLVMTLFSTACSALCVHSPCLTLVAS